MNPRLRAVLQLTVLIVVIGALVMFFPRANAFVEMAARIALFLVVDSDCRARPLADIRPRPQSPLKLPRSDQPGPSLPEATLSCTAGCAFANSEYNNP